MIYTTELMVYASFSYYRSLAFRRFLAVGLVGLAAFITLYYHYLQDPTFHQNAYALLTATVLIRSMFIMEFSLRPALRGPESTSRVTGQKKAYETRENIRDRDILIRMWKLIGFGLSIFLSGFGIWHLDNLFCGTLRRWRHDVGLPWGIVLEGHGWWYVFQNINMA